MNAVALVALDCKTLELARYADRECTHRAALYPEDGAERHRTIIELFLADPIRALRQYAPPVDVEGLPEQPNPA